MKKIHEKVCAFFATGNISHIATTDYRVR